MGRVTTGLAVSLDGYIAGPGDGPQAPLGHGGEQLFEWYFNGDTPSRHYDRFRLSKQSAEFWDAAIDRGGALITGRRTYDIANGWEGNGPAPGIPLVVLTHSVPDDVPSGPIPYTFVTTGIEDAVAAARELADGKDVALMGSAPVQQALAAGLMDQIVLHVVPVLLGGGVRLLDGVSARLRLDQVVDAPGVTHLVYDVL
jgi:dihydrofolate reductase